jgi:hypothetical protein
VKELDRSVEVSSPAVLNSAVRAEIEEPFNVSISSISSYEKPK